MEYKMSSDIGNVRKVNEDFCGGEIIGDKNESVGIFVIADGMGGHKKGEIASKLAVENMIYFLKNNLSIHNFNDVEKINSTLKEAYNYANTIVYRTSIYEKDCDGMGTTLTTALTYKNELIVANVGDSRCYLLKGENLRKITNDNSLIQELIEKGVITEKESLNHPQRNVITRAVGTDEHIKIDFYRENITKDDKIILTTDGLTHYLSVEEMKEILHKYSNLSVCCDNMISLAKQRGGHDNISVICVSI